MISPIPHNWEVPTMFRDRLGTHAGRQRTMFADGHLLLILHGVPDAHHPDAVDARLFWRKPDGTWKAANSGATTIGALRMHVEQFAATIDQLEAKAARATKAKDWFEILHAIAPLARTVKNQSTTLQEARDLVKADRELITVRDLAQENERAVDLISSHARAGLDYAIAAAAEHNAHHTEHVVQSQHRLNRIAATFLPIGAVGAVLGMNLPSGLEHYASPYTFWLVAAGAFLLGFVVRAAVPKRADV